MYFAQKTAIILATRKGSFRFNIESYSFQTTVALQITNYQKLGLQH